MNCCPGLGSGWEMLDDWRLNLGSGCTKCRIFHCMGEVGAPLRMSPQVAEHGEEAPMTWLEWRGMLAWPWGMAGSKAWAEGRGRVQVPVAQVV
jgi:hypothetical protein